MAWVDERALYALELVDIAVWQYNSNIIEALIKQLPINNT